MATFSVSDKEYSIDSVLSSTGGTLLLGNNSVGTNFQSIGGATAYFLFTASANGTLTDITMYMAATGNNIQYAVYNSSGTLLAQTSPVAVTQVGWLSIPLQNGVSISSGTQYYLAEQVDVTVANQFAFVSSGGSWGITGPDGFPTFPSSASVIHENSNNFSIYGKFTPASIAIVTAGEISQTEVVGTQTSTLLSSSTYTGTAQAWTVPVGVTQVQITLQGSAGLSGDDAGGKGGQVTGVIKVVPGSTYYYYIGGQAHVYGGQGGDTGIGVDNSGGDPSWFSTLSSPSIYNV
ncbi:MAG: DUF4082 domain-containing protein, partial [Rhabdochlamydiaceae bacterium]